MTISVSSPLLKIGKNSTMFSTADASGYHDLKLSFNYDVRKLESDEQLLYGWSAGNGTDYHLGTINGQEGSKDTEEGTVTDAVLPVGADVNNLQLNFSNNGKNSSDDVTISNITLTGIPNTVTSNRAPVVVNGTLSIEKNQTKIGQLQATDADGDNLTYSTVTPPQHGAVTLTGAQYTYTPNADFTGSDNFTFKANDGTVDSNVATVNIMVAAPADTTSQNSVTLMSHTANSVTLAFNVVDGDTNGSGCFDAQADPASSLPGNQQSICLGVGTQQITFNVSAYVEVRENLLTGDNTDWQRFNVAAPLDVTGPAITVNSSSPDNGDYLNGTRFSSDGQRNRFIFNVADPSGVQKVAMYVSDASGNKVKEYALTQHGAPHEEQWYADVDTTQFADGEYQIAARAVDNATPHHATYFNNRRNSYGVTIDNTAPTISVQNGYVGDKDQKIFSKVGFNFHDKYQIDKYTINSHEVNLTNNTYSNANFQNIKQYLQDGSNTLKLYDVAGNEATYDFTYDTHPAVVTVTSPQKDGAYGGTVTVNGTVTDDYGLPTEVTAHVRHLKDNGKCDGFLNDLTATVDANGNWSTSFDSSAFADGNYCVTVVATDAAGNTNGGGVHVKSFVIDNTAPTLVAKNATWNSPNSPAIQSGSIVSKAADSDLRLFATDSNIDHILMDGNTKWSGSWITGAGGVGIAYITSGTHTFQAVDKAGNVSGEITLTFDNEGPSVTIDSPTAGTVTSRNGLTVHGTVDTSDISGVDRVVVYVKDLTTGTQSGTMQATVSGNEWTIDLDSSLVPDGHQVRIVAYAKDGVKNTGQTTSVEVTADNTAPALQSVNVTGTGDNSRTLSGTTEPGATVTVAINGNIYTLTADPTTGEWSLDLDVTSFIYGQAYNYSVVAADAYGNSSAAQTGSITIPNPGQQAGFAFSRQLGVVFSRPQPQQVAPVQPKSEKNDDTGVLGARTANTDPTDATPVAASPQGWKFFGIAWYWWLLVAAIIASIIVWVTSRMKRRSQLA